MPQRSRLSTGLSGVAGEYFVAAELSRRGYVASLTLRNTKGIDILASNLDATRSVGIQVKTNQGSGQGWMLNKKAEEDTAENLFYVFVRLNGLDTPEYYVVPRAEVAKHARESHRKWLETPGRGGRPHVDSAIRGFSDPENIYRDRWDSLGLDTPVI
jgi:hypothetical protein